MAFRVVVLLACAILLLGSAAVAAQGKPGRGNGNANGKAKANEGNARGSASDIVAQDGQGVQGSGPGNSAESAWHSAAQDSSWGKAKANGGKGARGSASDSSAQGNG